MDPGPPVLFLMARPRAMPHLGAPVTVVFLAVRVAGVVVGVDADARRVEVATEDGQSLVFVLSRATGTFLANGQQSGARLLFEG
jgi:hypothetical protein